MTAQGRNPLGLGLGRQHTQHDPLWGRLWGLYLFGRKPYMSTNLANHSNTSRQIEETSRSVGYTARPAPGEAASPWQAIYTGPSLMRVRRIQSRMAQACIMHA